MDDTVATFMAITAVEDAQTASHFLEMANNDLETAVSLYFEHGPSVLNDSGSGRANNSGAGIDAVSQNDDEYAQKLQEQMYNEESQQDQYRAPIQPTHDTLMPQDFGGYFPRQQIHAGGMFGNAQQSIFNQNEVINLDSDDSDQEDEFSGMSSTQKKLANIFRPPWDIIEKLDLDTAKKQASATGKWILINIQDVTDFRCQCLNRDLWSSNQVKQFVSKNFIFLQYQNDSPSGSLYSNLYPFEDFPHIAILDPITGERMQYWSVNPSIEIFLNEAQDFLLKHNHNVEKSINEDNYVEFSDDDDDDDKSFVSLESGPEFDAQLDVDDAVDHGKHDESHDTQNLISSSGSRTTALETTSKPLSYREKLAVLEEPSRLSIEDASCTTRIQIRSVVDNKRVVCKFNVDDTIKLLFYDVKKQFNLETSFILKMQMQKIDFKQLFMEEDNKTISDCGLKNASLLLEPLDDDDDDDENDDQNN